jgi:hypothetical protein
MIRSEFFTENLHGFSSDYRLNNGIDAINSVGRNEVFQLRARECWVFHIQYFSVSTICRESPGAMDCDQTPRTSTREMREEGLRPEILSVF